MPTVTGTKNVADWLKWGIMLSWAVIGVGVGYGISQEHRLTALETWKEGHTTSSAKTEADIRAQLDLQRTDGQRILTAITAVQVEVAKINGYIDSRKNPTAP
jgi:hypothetical protein